MAKRFTDSEKWKKSWFRTLRPIHKCFWEYVRDCCDHSGIWEVDFELASMMIGEEIHPLDAMEAFRKQYLPFALGKRWLILDFVEFQYGTLNPKNNAHNSVINSLKRNGVWEAFLLQKKAEADMKMSPCPAPAQPLPTSTPGALDKDMDKDQDSSSSTTDQSKKEDQDPAILQNLKSRLKDVAESSSSEQPRRKGRAKAARTICPEDFEISEALREYCRAKGHPEPDKFRDSFVNYWRGRGDLMADWSATFRNYMDGPFRQDKMEAKYGAKQPQGYESAAQRNNKKFKEQLGKLSTGFHPSGGDEVLPLLPQGNAGSGDYGC